jgi:antitoxin ParD1/3/4
MATAKTRSISLAPDIDDAIQRHRATGRYASDDEVIRAALRVLERDEEELARKLAALDAAIARGIADAEAGRVTPLEDAFARIRKELGFSDDDEGRAMTRGDDRRPDRDGDSRSRRDWPLHQN